MKIFTYDNRELTILRIGKPDSEFPTDLVYCLDDSDKSDKNVIIRLCDIKGVSGSFAFPPDTIKESVI